MSDKFELHLIRRQAPKEDPAAEKRRQDRETGRQQAMAFSQEALLTAVNIMRNHPDPAQKLKAAKMIMDRAWGTPKASEDDSKILTNRSIIEILANISSDYAQVTEIPAENGEEPLLIEQDAPLEALFIEEGQDDDEPE